MGIQNKIQETMGLAHKPPTIIAYLSSVGVTITEATLLNWRHNKTQPNAINLYHLANYFKCQMSDLVKKI